MGRGAKAAPVGGVVRLMGHAAPAPFVLPIFPLAGALLFPGAHLPLRLFEPRYMAMARDAMAANRLIGMIQPRDDSATRLYEIGAIGEIVKLDTMEDGALAMILKGLGRFRMLGEMAVDTPYRQVEAIALPTAPDAAEAAMLSPVSLGQRAALEAEARRFAEAHGYVVNWEAVSALDDEGLVNGIAQVAPFDVAAKQALLEAPDLTSRADLALQLLAFFARHIEEGHVTLQ